MVNKVISCLAVGDMSGPRLDAKMSLEDIICLVEVAPAPKEKRIAFAIDSNRNLKFDWFLMGGFSVHDITELVTAFFSWYVNKYELWNDTGRADLDHQRESDILDGYIKSFLVGQIPTPASNLVYNLSTQHNTGWELLRRFICVVRERARPSARDCVLLAHLENMASNMQICGFKNDVANIV